MSQPLSTGAAALLGALRRYGPTPQTDARLAPLIGVAPRDVIDCARELLDAGFLVLADGRGRWLGTPAEALRYDAQLGRRARLILTRRRAVRHALRRRGQGNLFPEGA